MVVDEEDGGVGFEVDSFGALDNFETFDSDVALVCKTETDEVQHGPFYWKMEGGSTAERWCFVCGGLSITI